MKTLKRAAALVFFAVVFLTFVNGYQQSAPARKKFKNLGNSDEVVDLTKEEVHVEVDRMKTIAGDKRLRAWEGWWKTCLQNFTLEEMADTGISGMSEEQIAPLTEALQEGPQQMFFVKSPDGKWLLNPWNDRLLYKKEGDAWQPYIEIPCGPALYDAKAKTGRKILECSALEGIDDAFWKDKETIVFMGYEALTRQMNVECEGVESCVSPVVWIVDLKTKQVSEHRGTVFKRKAAPCELGGYMKVRLPKFYNEEKKK